MEPRYKVLTARRLRLNAKAKGRDRERGARPPEPMRPRPIVTPLARPNENYAGLDWCLGDERR